MKTNKLLSAIKKAPFPTIMAIISFILFLVAYSFVTVKAIKPYYLMGLIFIIPFVSFGIIAYFTARAEIVPVISHIITILLIVVSVLIMFVTFTFISIDAATTETTDIEMYERVLKLKDYPENTLINYFPEKIPNNAENIAFRYNPAFVQGGENFQLKFKTDSNSINKYIKEFSQEAKWTGKVNDSETENNGVFIASFHALGYDKLPDDFTIYLIGSKPYRSMDWNHGELSLVAISKFRNEIIFVAEDW